MPDTIVADGNTTSVLTLALKDVNGNGVSGQTALFSTPLGGTTFSAVTDNQDGTYTATLKGIKAGDAKISVSLSGVAFAVAPVTVKLIADSSKLDKGKSSLSATPLTIVADGNATSVLKLDLRDVNNNAVPGQTVVFTTALADTSVSAIADNQDGTYTATLKGTKAGDAPLNVTVNGAAFVVAPVTVILTPDTGNLDKDKSVLTAAPLTIVADGEVTSALKLTLKDANGNLVKGQAVVFGTALGGTTFSAVTDNQDGTYTATLKGTKSGDALLNVTVNGTVLAVTPVTVTLTPDSSKPDNDKSTLTAVPLSIVADNASMSSLKLTLKDVNGNLVKGQAVVFGTALGGTTFSAVTDNQDGTYTATLKGTKSGDAILNVTVNGTVLAVAPVTVTLTPDSSKLDKDKSTLTAVPLSIVADNASMSSLKLTLKDVNGNLVKGQAVVFSTELGGTTFSTVTDNQDGTYTATLKGKTAGNAVLNVIVNGTVLSVTPVTVTLTADNGNLSKDKSVLTAAPLSIVADNTETSSLKLTLKDVNGNLVKGQTVVFSTTLGDTTFSAVTDNQDGTYTATLKGTKAGDAPLTVIVNGTGLAVTPVTVTLAPDSSKLDKDKSGLTATPATIVANNTAVSTLKLTLKDVNGNLVKGQTVLFSTTLDNTTISTVTDNQDGTYTATLKGTQSGTAAISVTVNSVVLAVTPVTVKLTADSSKLDKDKSSLTAVPLSIVADGTQTSALKLDLRDINNNPVTGQTVTISTTLDNTTISTVTDNQDGTYTATLKGTKAGSALLAVAVNGTVLSVTPVTVTLTADSSKLDKDKSVLTGTPLTIVANNTETSELKLTLKDVNGNVVSGQTVLFNTTLGDTTFSAVTDNQDGTYTATLKGTKAGDALITVTVGGNALAVAAVTVKLMPDSSKLDKDKSALTATPLTIVADNATTSGLKLTLKDVNGNAVSGQTVLFSTALGGTTFSAVTDNQDGTYTATLKGTKAGDALITVAVGGNALAVAAVTVKLTPDSSKLDKDKSGLTATPATIVANNTDISTLILTLKDVNSNAVSGQTVVFSTALGGTTFSAVTDNQDGTYTATLKGKTAGGAVIKVTVNGAVLDVAAVTVKLIGDQDNLDKDKSALSANPLSIVANNTATSVLKLTLKDVNDNPVTGQTVLFGTPLADTTISAVTDNQDGTYTATLKGTKAGAAVISVMVGGNALSVTPVTVSLTPDSSKLDKDKSALTATPVTIVADNATTSVLKLTLKDVNDNPVSGQTVLFSTALAGTTFSTVTDNQDGTYTATLKGTKAGDALITVKVGDNVLAVAAVTVKLTADSSKLDKDKSALTGTPLTIVANNTTTSELKLTLKDINDNPVSGQTVLFGTTLVNTTFSAVTDNQDGTYTATLKGKTAGDALISVTVAGNVLAVAPVTIKLTADSSKLDKDKSALTGTPLTIVANNTATSELKLTLKDVNDNPVSGQTVLFGTALANTTFSAVTDNQDGTYTATLKGTKAGDAVISVKVGGNVLAVASVTVILTADSGNLSKDKSELTVVPDTIVADGNTASTLTLSLKDANGNPVAGQTVLFNTTLEDTVFSSVTDNQDGTYTATLKGTKAGSAPITVTVEGTALAVAQKTVNLIGDAATARISSVKLKGEVTRKVANSTNKFEFITTVIDVNNNPVPDMVVTWIVNKPDTTKLMPTAPKTGSDGTVQAVLTLTSSLTPTYDIIVSAAIAGQDKVDANLLVSFEELFKSTITVVDAGKTGTVAIEGARIEIYSENKGEKLVDQRTPDSGKIQVELVAGKYAIVITKDGYRTYDDFIEIRSGLDLNYQYGLIQIGDNDAKIIVQWLENKPKDPDTYIKLPDGVNIYRGNKTNGNVTLDRDNTSAPGLETITIKTFQPGKYIYALECYNCTWSNFNDTDTKVSVHINDRVTLAAGTAKDTYVSSPGTAAGTSTKFWRVLEINVDNNRAVSVKMLQTYTLSF
ncbi:MAG TPA: hypothetical protein DIT05_11920 [Morganella sp. (in: Bacteria)]|nr:hypothetical protein [Morganella sp. (in: enterobacteria)]